ncbi:ATPase AAA family [Patulibacter medicamentivorans]|uniref:ATPase AAA family n=1 Tax=Patulibacter medicamentivorans TaxID=1097667 RepID=H0DZP9_9ACTN|nr:replication-associated recombination protein A [Patulibacter medicamentivorans]EHN13097.1 ATPase AAA family [Patulibacter medicamentivorans]
MDRLFAPDPDDGTPTSGGGASLPADAPLAARLRPATVEDVVGQAALLGEGRPLRAAIDSGTPHAMLLHGPPGSGKTTLARIVADAAGAAVEALQAVDAGKAEVRAALQRARERRASSGTPTVLFIDEIHRFNRTQQDALLPAVEEGLVTLIAATTEPPWAAVSPALRSRLRIYRLRALAEADVLVLLRRAMERRLLDRDGEQVRADDDALELLASRSAGDARTALGALEAATGLARAAAATVAGEVDGPAASAPVAKGSADGQPANDTATNDTATDDTATDAPDPPPARPARTVRVTGRQASAALDRTVIAAGPDQPHDLLSAYIKSIRGSDPDAAVYYLAGMLAAGEDPRTIARRLVVSASEDVGLADPYALPMAIAAAEVVDRIGMPECRIALSHVTIRLALAGKSSAAYRAINDALEHVAEHGVDAPPPYLRGKISDGARPQDYDYPHANPGGFSDQELLPPALADHRFLQPAPHETVLLERLAAARRGRGRKP